MSFSVSHESLYLNTCPPPNNMHTTNYIAVAHTLTQTFLILPTHSHVITFNLIPPCHPQYHPLSPQYPPLKTSPNHPLHPQSSPSTNTSHYSNYPPHLLLALPLPIVHIYLPVETRDILFVMLHLK
mmetsp:Transcript_433/g.621  ORF Transcript_433/g.621 Transcript_433/m.621 type:complete len:126 (-) Transcript_433:1748-2125(-)